MNNGQESHRLFARSLLMGCNVGIVALLAATSDEFETPGFNGRISNEIIEELKGISRCLGSFKDQTKSDSIVVKVVGYKGRSWLALRLGTAWVEGRVLVAGPFAKIGRGDSEKPSLSAASLPVAGEDRFFFVGQLAVIAMQGVNARFPLVPVTLFLKPTFEVSAIAFTHKHNNADEALPGEVTKRIRDCIRSGDIDGLRRALLSEVTLLPGIVDPGETYRFYRQKYLASCGTCSEIALDSGLDYEKVMALTEKYILLVDKSDDLGTLGHLAFRLFEEFTREISNLLEAKNSVKVRKMIAYIEGNLEKSVCLGDVANAVDLSPSYATALLKKETDRSFSETLREVRVKEAKKLLRCTNLSIKEVAALTGFTLPNHFSKLFRETTGTNPSEFRKNLSKK